MSSGHLLWNRGELPLGSEPEGSDEPYFAKQNGEEPARTEKRRQSFREGNPTSSENNATYGGIFFGREEKAKNLAFEAA